MDLLINLSLPLSLSFSLSLGLSHVNVSVTVCLSVSTLRSEKLATHTSVDAMFQNVFPTKVRFILGSLKAKVVWFQDFGCKAWWVYLISRCPGLTVSILRRSCYPSWSGWIRRSQLRMLCRSHWIAWLLCHESVWMLWVRAALFSELKILRNYAKPSTVNNSGGTCLRMWHLPFSPKCGLKGVTDPDWQWQPDFIIIAISVLSIVWQIRSQFGVKAGNTLDAVRAHDYQWVSQWQWQSNRGQIAVTDCSPRVCIQ